MSGNRLLVDTNVIIYLFKNEKNVVEFLQGKEIYISSITEIELLSFPGLTDTDRDLITEFLSKCEIVDLISRVKTITIEIRQTHKLKLPDAIIAATARFLNIPIITADKVFTRLIDLNVILLEL